MMNNDVEAVDVFAEGIRARKYPVQFGASHEAVLL